jgi:purine-binding chemotaxis protein CheW
MNERPMPTRATEQFLTFFVAGDEYAVRILEVREILELGPVTPVPSTPEFVRGVMNVRGAALPLIDLGAKLRLGLRPLSRRSCVLVVDVDWDEGRVTLGLVAEAVGRVVDLAADDVEPPPAFGTPVGLAYLRGMAKLEKRFALLLDLARVLSRDEVLLAAAASERGGLGAGAGAGADDDDPAAALRALGLRS